MMLTKLDSIAETNQQVIKAAMGERGPDSEECRMFTKLSGEFAWMRDTLKKYAQQNTGDTSKWSEWFGDAEEEEDEASDIEAEAA